jgi:hypothetical protein
MTGIAWRQPGRRFSHHRPRSRPGALEPRGGQGGLAAGLASFTQAGRGGEPPIWSMPTRIAESATDRAAVRSRACFRRGDALRGPGDGHDDAGHQQVPGPARKPRRTFSDADVAVGEQRCGPAPGIPGRRLSAACWRASAACKRTRAASGCSMSGQTGKRLLAELADHAGSRRQVRGGGACSDGGSLAPGRAADPYESVTDSPAPPGVRQSGYGEIVTCHRAWPPGRGGGAPGC